MIQLKEATAIAVDLVISKAKHPDYDHVVELSEVYYRPLATGKGIEKLMRKFDPREDDVAFQQRVNITQHTTPATWDTLLNPIRKLESVRPVVDRMEWSPENAAAEAKVKEATAKFRGGKSVDNYIASLTDAAEIDPNAFELLVFDPFDPRSEVPRPYAVHVSCRDAWNFEYFNDELQFLLVHRSIKYIAIDKGADGKPVTKDGHRFVMYVSDFHIVFEQVRAELGIGITKGTIGDGSGNTIDGSAVTFGNETTYYLKVSETEVYRVTFFDQKSGRVPAFRLGSRRDPITDGRTCVNTIHAAMPYLLKSVKSVSEMDLTTALHVFPKKWQYAPRCMAEGCNGGTMPDGTTKCTSCKGTGKAIVIGSAQEVNTLAMPDNPSEMFDLTKMVYYEPTDVAVIQQLREINEEVRVNSIRAVYAGDMFTKDQVNVTATAKAQELDSAYSALRPRIRWREDTKPTIVHVIAQYLDSASGLTVTTVLPQNLRYETEGDMVSLMKESAPVAGRAYMASKATDLIMRAYADDPEAQKRALVQERFNPYQGMDRQDVMALISGGQTLEENALMWTEADTIWDIAESEHKGEVSLYDLDDNKLRTVVYAIRDRLLAEKQEKAAAKAPQIQLGMDPEADPDQENEGEEDAANAA